METHWPSLQVKDPGGQAVTFTLICLELDLAVQGSLMTLEKSNSCRPSRREISEAKLDNKVIESLYSCGILVNF